MSQNLISLSLSAAELTAIQAAVETLQQKLSGLIELSVTERRGISKMGAKSEAFCRQMLIILDQNKQFIPSGIDLPKAQADLVVLDQLRPIFASLRLLVARANDTEMALGSDIMNAALDGYGVARVLGKGVGLDALREAMSSRFSRKRKNTEQATT